MNFSMENIGWLLYLVYPLIIFICWKRTTFGRRINAVVTKIFFGIFAVIGFFSYFWFVSNFNFLLIHEKIRLEKINYSSGVVWHVGSRNGVVIVLANGERYYCDSNSSGVCLVSMREKEELKTKHGFMNGFKVKIGWKNFYDLRVIYSIDIGGKSYVTERESELRFNEQYDFAKKYTWIFLAVSIFCFILFLIV